MVKFFLDDRKVEAPEGASLLDVARDHAIHIPTLCHHQGLEPSGACRLCMVEITMPSWGGWSRLVTSCLYPVAEDLRVYTMSERVKKTRALVLDLLLARCPNAPLIQDLAREYGVATTSFTAREEADDCILCGLCVRACEKVGAYAICTANRGHKKVVTTPFGEPPEACIGCGACAEVCPTNCIPVTTEQGTRRIWDRDFEMLRCQTCNATFMTQAERDFLSENRKPDASFYDECPDCKRKRVGASMARVVLKTNPGFTPKQSAAIIPPVVAGQVVRRHK